MHSLPRTRTRAVLAGAVVFATLLAGCSGSSGESEPTATGSEKSEQLTDARPEVASQSIELANGYFSVDLPENWSMREIEPEYYQYNQQFAASVEFLNPEGQVMAKLRTGADSLAEDALPSTPEENILVDGASLNPTEGPHFSFISAAANPDTALIALTEVSPDQQADFRPDSTAFNHQGGSATFERMIGPETELTNVDPDLHGAQRMRAYLETNEYAQLKSLMMSFTQLKDITVDPPQEPTSTPEG